MADKSTDDEQEATTEAPAAVAVPVPPASDKDTTALIKKAVMAATRDLHARIEAADAKADKAHERLRTLELKLRHMF